MTPTPTNSQPPAAGEAAHPELYWSPCPDSNRAFLSLAGVDNNVAEVFPVEHMDFISAHDVACRISRRYNSHAALVAALESMTAQFGHYCEHTEDEAEVAALTQARAALAAAKESQP